MRCRRALAARLRVRKRRRNECFDMVSPLRRMTVNGRSLRLAEMGRPVAKRIESGQIGHSKLYRSDNESARREVGPLLGAVLPRMRAMVANFRRYAAGVRPGHPLEQPTEKGRVLIADAEPDLVHPE